MSRVHKISFNDSGPVVRKQSVAEQRSTFQSEIEKRASNIVPTPVDKFVPKHISPCQTTKLIALFEQYFDVDRDGFLTEGDITALNEKIFQFTKWSPKSEHGVKLIDFHKDLFACLLVDANRDVMLDENKTNKISLNAWLQLWDQMLKKSLILAHLPQWIQVLPLNLFTFIDKDGERKITKKDLLEFFRDFMGLKPEMAAIVRDRAYSEMTGNGDYPLNMDLYTTAFSNFLFGKSFYGPGKFVLGTFDQCIYPQQFKMLLKD